MTELKPEYDAQDKTIFRRAKDKDNPFVMIDRTIFSDEKTSWKAKGLLGYLLSKPDDWITRMGDLVKRATDGRYATASAIRELEARGYLTRYQEKDEHGRFKQLVIEVHEVPVIPDRRPRSPEKQPQSGFQLADNPLADVPLAGNQSITNTDCTDTDCTNIPPAQNSASSSYQVRVKKEKAMPRVIVPDAIDQANLRDNPDMWDLARKTEAAQAETGNYAVPAEAGGANPWADGPVDAFAEVLAGIVPVMLPEKERKSWARKLGQIAIRWSTENRLITPTIMMAAIRAVPDSDIGWKTYKSPFAGKFEDEIGSLLLNGGHSGNKKGAPQPDSNLTAAQRAVIISRQHDEERRQRGEQH